MSCIHHSGEVNARALAEKTPEMTRQERQHGLAGQQQRYPLIVADLGRGIVQPTARDRPLDRQVVGVADPAHRVGVVTMTVGELGRAPAGDRTPNELLRADEKRETYEQDDSILATQSVDVVIVSRQLYLAYAQQRLKQFLHVRSSAV